MRFGGGRWDERPGDEARASATDKEDFRLV